MYVITMPPTLAGAFSIFLAIFQYFDGHFSILIFLTSVTSNSRMWIVGGTVIKYNVIYVRGNSHILVSRSRPFPFITCRRERVGYARLVIYMMLTES